MKKGQRLWSRNELLLTLNLYYKLPFGKLHSKNPAVTHLAGLIDRSPSAVAYKLVNFASLDPSLKARGIKGAYNASDLDKEIWTEFSEQLDILVFESEKILSGLENISVEKLNNIPENELPSKGKMREQTIMVGVNQSFFRKSILASYNGKCCITGISYPELLIAAHIMPWGVDEVNRLNPRNGLLLNGLHDKAFEHGLLTITPEYRIKVSPLIHEKKTTASFAMDYFIKYDNEKITLPGKFYPDPVFLIHHNEKVFKSQ